MLIASAYTLSPYEYITCAIRKSCFPNRLILILPNLIQTVWLIIQINIIDSYEGEVELMLSNC